MKQWTPDQVRSLGVTTDVPTAGSVLGMSRHTSYELARRGAFPVPVLRLGRKIVVPVAGLVTALGLAETALATTHPAA